MCLRFMGNETEDSQPRACTMLFLNQVPYVPCSAVFFFLPVLVQLNFNTRLVLVQYKSNFRLVLAYLLQFLPGSTVLFVQFLA